MKKRGIIKRAVCSVLMLALTLTCGSAVVLSARAEEDAAKSSATPNVYNVDFSTLTEDELRVNPRSNAAASTVTYDDWTSSLQLKGTSEDGAGSYWGLLWDLPLSEEKPAYTDFTFSIKFRFANFPGNGFFAILYRTENETFNGQDGYTSGYVLNSRANETNQSGYSAYRWNGSTVAYNDTDARANPSNFDEPNGPSLTDFKYHTITIVMEGTHTKHYLDGYCIREVWTDRETAGKKSQDEALGKAHPQGGFSFVVARKTQINIQSISISDVADWTVEKTQPKEQGAPRGKDIAYTSETFAAWKEKGSVPTLNGASDFTAGGATEQQKSRLEVNGDNELVMTGNLANQSGVGNYWGALWDITPWDTDYQDLTFTMKFKWLQDGGNGRFFTIWLHTQTATGGTMSAYGINYRFEAAPRSAMLALKAKSSGGDKFEKRGNPVVNDGRYHTVVVTIKKHANDDYSDIAYVMDKQLIHMQDLSAQELNHLSEPLKTGGVSLTLNRSQIAIQSLSVERGAADLGEITHQTVKDKTMVSTYQDPEIKMINAPTVVLDVKDKTTLDGLTSAVAQDGKRPSNAILRFNRDAKIVTADGTELGTFTEVYAALDHKVIPVLKIGTQEEADALIAYFADVREILDISVMSNDPALVKAVKDAYPAVRGMVEFTEEGLYTQDKLELYDNVISVCNANRAVVAVLPQSVATVENVRYLHGRFKTVWITAESHNTLDLHTSILSGAYGVVTDDFSATYTVLEGYSANSLARTPINVGHRALPGALENSVTNIERAIAAGVSHLELDGHLTKADENGVSKMVIMHDDTLRRTCIDKTIGQAADAIKINSLTLKELRERYTLAGGEQIPILDDVCKILAREGNEHIVLLLELKAGNGIAEEVKRVAEEYGVTKQIVVISFATDLIAAINRVIPGMPTALLQSASEGNKISADTIAGKLELLGSLNSVLDSHFNNMTKADNEEWLRDRGHIGWYWTFANTSQIDNGLKNGYVGITNDAADSYAKVGQRIEGAQDKLKSLSKRTTILLKLTHYDGTTETVKGYASYVEEKSTCWHVVCSYTLPDKGVMLYTQPFTILKAQEQEHTHTYSEGWSNNETHHWHAATCGHTGEVNGKAEHTFEDGVCSTCGYEQKVSHEHTYSEEWSNNETHHWHEATCEHTGEVSGKAEHTFEDGVCSICGQAEKTDGGNKKKGCSGAGATSAVFAGCLAVLTASVLVALKKRRT